MTEGSGTSAQITGLLASTRFTADEVLDCALDVFVEVIALDELLEVFVLVAMDEVDAERDEDATELLLQGEPVMVGVSAPEAVVPWNPNSTLWLGWMLAFQSRLLAV